MISPLEVKNLTKVFTIKPGEVYTAVNNVTFSVPQGHIMGLLGANGAGKTTIIQMLLSTLTPTHGTIRYFGKDLAHNRSEVLEKVAFASTYVELPAALTVKENLLFAAQMQGLSRKKAEINCQKYLEAFLATDLQHRYTGTLSAGQLTRIMLVKAFLVEPAVLLLDEPTAALDPDIAQEVRSCILQQQKEQAVSVLLTSHNMTEVTELCDSVMVLQKGEIIAQDTPENLAAQAGLVHISLQVESLLKAEAVRDMLVPIYAVETTGTAIRIACKEEEIAAVLIRLARADIHYTHLSLDKPTLEDYFIGVVKAGRTS